jgi:hypothetical protein
MLTTNSRALSSIFDSGINILGGERDFVGDYGSCKGICWTIGICS